MSEFTCVNCGAGTPMDRPPIPNDYGRNIQAKVCSECFSKWKDTEVMIINEYRLNLLERGDRQKLREQMESFLNLDGSRAAGEAGEMKPEGYVAPEN